MNDQTKQDILAWAQTQVTSWAEYQEDWWGAYNDEWDINIWDSTVFGDGDSTERGLVVTAYRMVKHIDGIFVTDMTDNLRIGFIGDKK